MSEECRNIYKKARRVAGLTQEAAAERLGISVESVRAYETGQRVPPNDVVEDMVVCYDYQKLAFQHLHETNTLAAKVVPQLEERTLLETAIRIYNRLRRLEKGETPLRAALNGSREVGFTIISMTLSLVAVFIEPAKVLFLNNAINHGIFSPIGAGQAAETGRSIMYMLESNPGPGLGVLLAYWFCSKDKQTRQSAPGAVIIHLLGGIHEIYFPYILMNPVIIAAPILGNICAIFFYALTGAGLSGPASPGSLIAYMAMAPRDAILPVLLLIIVAGGRSRKRGKHHA